MEIFFLCDDADDATIFADAIHEIDSNIQCNILTSKVEVTVALTGRKGLTPLFLDLNNLPEKFTKNLIQHLRSDERWRSVKIIVYTNSFEFTKQKREELAKLGADDFVIKTSDLSLMRTSILNCIK